MSALDIVTDAQTPPRAGCEHQWGKSLTTEPLYCTSCGALWPGEPLPAPAHTQNQPDWLGGGER